MSSEYVCHGHCTQQQEADERAAVVLPGIALSTSVETGSILILSVISVIAVLSTLVLATLLVMTVRQNRTQGRTHDSTTQYARAKFQRSSSGGDNSPVTIYDTNSAKPVFMTNLSGHSNSLGIIEERHSVKSSKRSAEDQAMVTMLDMSATKVLQNRSSSLFSYRSPSRPSQLTMTNIPLVPSSTLSQLNVQLTSACEMPFLSMSDLDNNSIDGNLTSLMNDTAPRSVAAQQLMAGAEFVENQSQQTYTSERLQTDNLTNMAELIIARRAQEATNTHDVAPANSMIGLSSKICLCEFSMSQLDGMSLTDNMSILSDYQLDSASL